MNTRNLILTGLFAGLTAVGALITIPLPFSPVPITLQIFFTLLAGIILGSRYGALSQVVYLLLGGIGLPVFAGGTGGFQVLVGPSAGYLWGFVIAAFVVGLVSEQNLPHSNLSQRKSAFIRDLLGMLLGLIMIYLAGMLGLHLIAGMAIKQALVLGVIPFFAGDMLKILLVVFISDQLRKKIPEIFERRGY